ncbi:MAG TPA: hypothetical protein VE422_23400 [Terriglobia bacterium]|nr:hypothetical protein [Terriglobia bacterium]
MRFTPPTSQQVTQAIGPLDELPEPIRAAFQPDEDFERIPTPGPNDWLANHQEPGQTFEEFVKSRPNKPDAVRNKIYLQQLLTLAAVRFDDEAEWLERRPRRMAPNGK